VTKFKNITSLVHQFLKIMDGVRPTKIFPPHKGPLGHLENLGTVSNNRKANSIYTNFIVVALALSCLLKKDFKVDLPAIPSSFEELLSLYQDI